MTSGINIVTPLWCHGPECRGIVGFVLIGTWRRSNFTPAARAVIDILECPRCGARTWRYQQ
ncbi:MAG: hypothetical protein F4Z40_00865 [Chloroflexi bacterium]|nr:hypothetical protein [Chloroflexota bacterium]